MDCLLDTNILLRALDRHHQQYRTVRRAIIVLRRQGHGLFLTSQNLIEFWAVATRPVDSNGLGMSIRWTLAQVLMMKRLFQLLPETAGILGEWERLVTDQQVSGKKVHDARLVAVMTLYRITHILTFNMRDFTRYPGITAIHPRDASVVPTP
jgi:predicted nucleic acid-binding protein